jgi:hypothetical protein
MSRYRVTLCTQPGCGHPGGQHFVHIGVSEDKIGCRLCDCPGWDELQTKPGYWSDEQQHAAEAGS